MPPIGTLWGSPRQPRTKIIQSVAALNDLELNQPLWKHADRPADYASKFMYGKIPAFEGLDGFQLTEGVSIARYLCGLGTKVNLLGSDTQEIALVDQWIHFTEQEIGQPSFDYMMMVVGLGVPFSRKGLDKYKERLARSLHYVESCLAMRPSGYLISDSLTLADLFLVGMVHWSAFLALGAAERAEYPLVFGHFDRVTGDERLKRFWGKEEFTEVAATEPKWVPLQ